MTMILITMTLTTMEALGGGTVGAVVGEGVVVTMDEEEDIEVEEVTMDLVDPMVVVLEEVEVEGLVEGVVVEGLVVVEVEVVEVAEVVEEVVVKRTRMIFNIITTIVIMSTDRF